MCDAEISAGVFSYFLKLTLQESILFQKNKFFTITQVTALKQEKQSEVLLSTKILATLEYICRADEDLSLTDNVIFLLLLKFITIENNIMTNTIH